MSDEMVRLVAQASREKETRTRENLRKNRHSWYHLVSTWMALPARRALWVASSYDYTNPQWLDIGGGGYDLTNNNSAQFGYDASNVLIPTATTVSASVQLFSRADGGAGNWADITGTETTVKSTQRGLTLYAIVRFTNAASASEDVAGKWNTTGNQRSYRMFRRAAGVFRVSVSVDGAATISTTTTETLSEDVWYHLVLQYDPSTNLSAWVNANETANAVSIPASIFDSTASFIVGARQGPADLADADFAFVGLYAAVHSDTHILSSYHAANPLFKFGT